MKHHFASFSKQLEDIIKHSSRVTRGTFDKLLALARMSPQLISSAGLQQLANKLDSTLGAHFLWLGALALLKEPRSDTTTIRERLTDWLAHYLEHSLHSPKIDAAIPVLMNVVPFPDTHEPEEAQKNSDFSRFLLEIFQKHIQSTSALAVVSYYSRINNFHLLSAKCCE
eukprot:TRINITY_DN31120_c0_g1_i1.p1 TRINITY_DN31120_c0_g1~~TRINITY_DN31120_c0_g1_i1.p1  ORF type:complete len:169 (+),score=5.46 TRINITY_DN31120_c0_g1_i1:119-625(+)